MATKRQPSKRNRTARKARVVDIIVRVSRRNGREGASFHSVELQRERCEQWAALNGVRIGMVHDESDSVSGGTTKREGLQRAMQRATDGTTDGVMVMAVDRFARSLSEGVEEIKRLQAHGSSFIAVDNGIDTGAESDAMRATANLMLGFMFLLAEWQRESLTEKWAATRARQIEHLGIANHAPFGYRKREGDRVLVPEPAEAAAVVEMFERRAAGEGWAHISRKMTEAGVRTTNGNAFDPQRVRDCINRRAYLGEVSSGHDYVNANAHEPLVSIDLWERAHARAGKRGTEAREYRSDERTLTGIARCASCGGGMVAANVGKGGSNKPRYRCRINYGFGRCERPVTVDAIALEEHAANELLKAVRGLGAEVSEATDALDLARAALARAQHALTEWTTDTANDAIRAEAPEAYDAGTRARLDAVKVARDAVERESTAVGVRSTMPANLGEVWTELPAEERRGWLSSWFAVVAVHPPAIAGEPVIKRVDCFTVDDVDTPEGFVINDVGADGRKRRVAVRRPILKR